MRALFVAAPVIPGFLIVTPAFAQESPCCGVNAALTSDHVRGVSQSMHAFSVAAFEVGHG
jgi:hypothetical protein